MENGRGQLQGSSFAEVLVERNIQDRQGCPEYLISQDHGVGCVTIVGEARKNEHGEDLSVVRWLKML